MAIGDHQSGVEGRLRQAELQRAAAEARVAAERRARRLLIGIVAMLLLGAVAGWIAWGKSRPARSAGSRDEFASASAETDPILDRERCGRGVRAMASIRYLKGDATCPQAKGVKIVCHVCNDIGGWGKGFVLAVSQRWERARGRVPGLARARARPAGFALGAVQFVQVETYIWVANMLGQRGMKRGSSGPPIRYDALATCLALAAAKATELGASVHMPRIGCGLAAGTGRRSSRSSRSTFARGGRGHGVRLRVSVDPDRAQLAFRSRLANSCSLAIPKPSRVPWV